MSRLPPLPANLGEKMPADYGWMAGQARANVAPGDRGALEALLEEADIANFIHHRTGIFQFVPGGRLSLDDIARGRDLPEAVRYFLLEEERGISRAYVYDRLWEIRFSGAMEAARRSGVRFLQQYLSWDCQLRNFLSELRARASGRDAAPHLVRVGCGGFGFGRMAAGLQERPDPLSAMLYIAGQRLRFIGDCLDYDSFSLDALLGYLARARIFDQWQDYSLPYDLQTITQAGGSK
jgi:hypothetical protein